jgi:hypothetical protein
MQVIASNTFAGAEEDEQFNKKNNALRVAVVNVFHSLRKQISGLSAIRRDLLKINRLAYRFGATATALRDEFANMPADIRSLHMISSVEQAAGYLSTSAQQVADAVITQKKKKLQSVEASIAGAKAAVVALHQNPAIATVNRPTRVSIGHMLSLLDSAVRYLEDTLFLLNRMQSKKVTRQRQGHWYSSLTSANGGKDVI